MKILKEPLVHFLLLGGLIFALYYAFRGEDAGGDTAKEIVVPPGKIEQLAAIFTKTWQRPPTRDEIEALVDDHVIEEAYAREAIAMGLDEDDTVIRRRLRQKLEFLTGDLAALTQPTDEELDTYLTEHADDFREQPRYDFQQVFFNPEKLGDDRESALNEALDQLRAGEPVEGHPTLLPASREDATLRAVAATFGTAFANSLADLPTGEWQGPVESGFGLHFVRIDKTVPGRLPALDEIRAAVEREWANRRKEEMTREFNRELLARYQIDIQWPQPDEETP